MKSAVKLNRLLLKFEFLCQVKFLQRQRETQLFRDNLGGQKVLESAFFRISKNLKSKILGTIVPLPG